MFLHRLSLMGPVVLSLCCCDSFFQKSLSLSYEVFVADARNQEFKLEMTIHDAPNGQFYLQAHVFRGFTALGDFSARHYKGEELEIEFQEEVGLRQKRQTYRLKITNNLGKGNIKITYRARIGLKMYAKHGMESRYTYGYMSERYALVSGRSLFLIPEVSIDSVKIRFVMPPGWDISSPWKESDGWFIPGFSSTYLKEELANTNLALGLLERRTERVGDTDVSVSFFKDWNDSTKEELYKNAVALYRSVLELLGGGGRGTYVFNFSPRRRDGLMVQTTYFFNSQGAEMEPATPERWLESAEKLIDRWIKLPPFRMTYKSKEDYWAVDGIRRYYAIKICDELGLLDGNHYLEAERRRFIRAVSRGHAENLHFVMNDRIDDRSDTAIWDVRKLFIDNSNVLRHRREKIAATVIAVLDQEIRDFSSDQQDFSDVLKYEYGKRQNLILLDDIETVVGNNISNVLRRYLHNLHTMLIDHDLMSETPSPPASWSADVDSTVVDTLKVLFTGNTYAFLEHCGCKVNQNGGIARRASVVSEVRKQYPDAVLIDLGNSFTSRTFQMKNQDVGELRLYLKSMDLMEYDAATVAFYELYGGVGLFNDMTSPRKVPFLCANVLMDGETIARPHISLRAGKFNLGIIGIFQHLSETGKDDTFVFQDRTHDLTFVDPINALHKYLPELQKENDFVVVVGALSPDFIREQLTLIDGIDIVLSTESSWGTLVNTERGVTYIDQDLSGFQDELLTIYAKSGLYALDIMDFFVNRRGTIVSGRRRIVPLSDEIQDDSKIRDAIDSFYTKSVAIDADVKPLVDWGQRNGIGYVGVEKCQSCHPDQYTQWQTTRHAFAMNTLLDVRRHYQPKCVVCHVTGAGYETGYQMGDLTHSLLNVQCEACHGPGGKHIEDPFRVDMLRTPSVDLCISCHDQAHSDFELDKYYPKVRH